MEGQSGGGKSKLLEELAQRSAERGIWVLPGQRADQTAQRPLQVLAGVVHEVVRRAAADEGFVQAVGAAVGPHLVALVDALPTLTGIFGPADSGCLGPTTSTVRRGAAEPVVAAASASGSKAAPRPHGRGRVLVVEDNPTNQMVAMGLLNRLGFDAEIASDGQQAVDAVAKSQYATVLMDCDMPVMDGYAAAAAIRRQEAAGVHIPIVAMTASAMVGDRERCLAAGMDDYVPKPVRLNELDRVLSLWSCEGAGS